MGLSCIPAPRSFASMPNSFFVSPQLVDPSKPFCVSAARYITSISLLMLLEVRAKGRVPLKDNQSSLGVDTTFGTGQALWTCMVAATAEIEIAASCMVAVLGRLLRIWSFPCRRLERRPRGLRGGASPLLVGCWPCNFRIDARYA